jgi:hypothetical protein
VVGAPPVVICHNHVPSFARRTQYSRTVQETVMPDELHERPESRGYDAAGAGLSKPEFVRAWSFVKVQRVQFRPRVAVRAET